MEQVTLNSLANYNSLPSVLGNKLISILARVRYRCMYSRNYLAAAQKKLYTISRAAGTFPGALPAPRAEQQGCGGSSPAARAERRL